MHPVALAAGLQEDVPDGATQKPNAPSPTANTRARISRFLRSRNRQAHDSLDPGNRPEHKYFCDAQSFSNCTDTSAPALAEDTFSCEGTVRDVGGCTNLLTGESAPYCVFMGEDMAEGAKPNRDAYLRGPPENFSKQIVDEFWYFV